MTAMTDQQAEQGLADDGPAGTAEGSTAGPGDGTTESGGAGGNGTQGDAAGEGSEDSAAPETNPLGNVTENPLPLIGAMIGVGGLLSLGRQSVGRHRTRNRNASDGRHWVA